MPVGRQSANPLVRWQRYSVIGAGLSLLLSGVCWIPVHYLLGAGVGELPHPVEPWLLRWHGLSAVAGVFALGLVAAGHMSRGWALRQRRSSGLALGLLAGAGVASGYAIAYLVPDSLRPVAGWAHAIMGFAIVGVGWAHRRTTKATVPLPDGRAMGIPVPSGSGPRSTG